MHSVDTLRIIWYVYKWIVLRYTYVNRIWDCSSPLFFKSEVIVSDNNREIKDFLNF